MSGLLTGLTFATAVACGAMGGVFFAFSTFVMPALDRLPAEQGIAAMQSINRLAVSSAFVPALVATAVACLVLVVAGLLQLGDDHGPWLVAGGAVYLLATMVLTAAYHVPRNDALESVDPSAPGAAATWSAYLSEWTTANHARAASGIVACGLLIAALRA